MAAGSRWVSKALSWRRTLQAMRASLLASATATVCCLGVFVVDGAGVGWRIRLPEVYANIAFGGPKRDRLFMTASQSPPVWQSSRPFDPVGLGICRAGAQAANEPEHDQNDQNQTKNATEPRSTVTAVSVIAAKAAKQENHQDDDQNSAHGNVPSLMPLRSIRLMIGTGSVSRRLPVIRTCFTGRCRDGRPYPEMVNCQRRCSGPRAGSSPSAAIA